MRSEKDREKEKQEVTKTPQNIRPFGNFLDVDRFSEEEKGKKSFAMTKPPKLLPKHIQTPSTFCPLLSVDGAISISGNTQDYLFFLPIALGFTKENIDHCNVLFKCIILGVFLKQIFLIKLFN